MAKKSTRTFLEFDKKSLPTYELLKETMRGAEKASPSNLEAFLFAMAFGFRAGNRVKEIKKSGTGVRVEYFRPEHEVLMAAVQLATTGDSQDLGDLDARYAIAEEFAEGGIRLLAQELAKVGDFNQTLASELVPVARALEETSPDDGD